MCAGKADDVQEIVFQSPEAEGREWEFLLFQPSAQHTAALCLQCSEIVPPALPDREIDSSTSSLSSRNGILSENAADSCNQSEMSGDLPTCMEASSASSNATWGDNMLAMATQEQFPAESQTSGGWHPGSGSSPDGEVLSEVGSTSGMPSVSSQTDTEDTYRGGESRELASRLTVWRVVPLVSESLIRTEDMDVLGMTA